MKNWKQVPIPPNMQGLEKDARGFPVPHIVLRDKNGKPEFTVNDARKVDDCIKNNLCAICGGFMGTDIWMTGGVMSAFHEYGAFIDSPVHYECGAYAMQVCPYLSTPSFIHKELDLNKTLEKDNWIYIDPTVMADRPPFFVMGHARGFDIQVINPITRYLKPHRPWIEVEYWNGVQLTHKQALDLLKPEHIGLFIPFPRYELEMQQQLHNPKQNNGKEKTI